MSTDYTAEPPVGSTETTPTPKNKGNGADHDVAPNVIKITTDFMAVRRRLAQCCDPVEVEKEIVAIRQETGLSTGAIKKCLRIVESERSERRQEKRKSVNEEGGVPLQLNDKGKPYAIVYNVMQVLTLDPRWEGVIRFNEFSGSTHFAKRPPFDVGSSDWSARDIADTDDTLAAAWMQQVYGLHISSGIAAEAINAVAIKHPCNPVKDYLASLTWDGTPRLDLWLEDFFGADSSPYTRAVASKTLIAAVARVFSPGCQVDTVLTLIGDQGIGKSKAFRLLAGDDWFSSSLSDMHSKDAMQHLRGKWILELSELSALARSDLESVKNYISRVQDGFRPAYGRREVVLRRQCIFVATTNVEKPLKDPTGNRRWWPVKVHSRLDAELLAAARDQLWAEALVRYQAGETWHLEGDMEAAAIKQQSSRVEEDDWADIIQAWLASKPYEVGQIMSQDVYELLKLDPKDQTPFVKNRVGAVMKSLGWENYRYRVPGGDERRYGYRKNPTNQ